MGKRPTRGPAEKQELATLGGRLKGLVNIKFAGSAISLVAATGISQPTWSRVLAGRQAPSWKLLAALIDLGVNVEWVLTGRGYPFLEDSPEHRAGKREFLVARAILPGPPEQCQEHLVGLDLHVDELTRSRSRYWLQIQDRDPIVHDDRVGIRAGDLIQMETDPTYWLSNLQRLRDAGIGAFRLHTDHGQILALGQINLDIGTPIQNLKMTANIFGCGEMPLDLSTVVLDKHTSDAARNVKEKFGKSLRHLDLSPLASTAPSVSQPTTENVLPVVRLAELIAVKVQVWRP